MAYYQKIKDCVFYVENTTGFLNAVTDWLGKPIGNRAIHFMPTEFPCLVTLRWSYDGERFIAATCITLSDLNAVLPQATVAQGYIDDYVELANPVEDPDNPKSFHHLSWMLHRIASNDMSATKANRWLGFVQCALCDLGLIDVKTERDRTRDIFNGA